MSGLAENKELCMKKQNKKRRFASVTQNHMFVPENSVICTSCNSQRSKTVAPKGRKGKTSRETTEAIFV